MPKIIPFIEVSWRNGSVSASGDGSLPKVPGSSPGGIAFFLENERIWDWAGGRYQKATIRIIGNVD